MVRLFMFYGDNIRYEVLVHSANERIVKLHQELSDSDDVLYLRMRKFVDALILAQFDFSFRVVTDIFVYDD